MATAKSPAPARLLVTALELPRADRNGGDLRLFEMLRLLARRHDVTFYPSLEPPGSPSGPAAAGGLRSIGVRVLAPGWTLGLERALLRRVYDGVIFEFWASAEVGMPLVRRHQPWARVVVDSVDVHFRREADGLALGVSDPATVAANKRRELAAYRAADAVVCVSGPDAEALEAEGGIPNRIVVPLIVPSRERSARDRGAALIFVGGFRHAPNVDGLAWFARDVWPSIRSAEPGARLTVVGADAPLEVAELAMVEGIEVVGHVPELGPYLDRAALMVAPLRFGAGMKVKVVEAMAAGLPVVSTSVGAQGLDAEPGVDLAVADSPAGFARSVVELLADPGRAEAMGRSGRELAARSCSPEAVSARLDALVDGTIGRAGPAIPPASWWARSSRFHARRAFVRAAGPIVAPFRRTTPDHPAPRAPLE